jgi:hypothetical protein
MADNLLNKASILLTPTAHNDGSMLSIKPENGDGDFQFSRGSAATRVNAQGLVENVQIISSELVSNGDFSQGEQDWSLGTGWSIGEDKAVLTNVGYNINCTQSNVTTIGQYYKVEFTILDYLSGGIRISLGGSATSIVSANGTYYFYIQATANNLVVLQPLDASGTNLSITNVSVKEITDDTDLPRIDYTDGCGSWLLEGQSTNMVTYSSDYSQWSNISTTLTSGYLAPDGTLGATKISGTIGASNIFLGVSSSTTATRTIYARTVSGTGTAKLMSYYQNTNNLFTLTEQWQRFEVNGTTTSTGGLSFYVDFRDNSQTLNEFIIWGAQSEELSYATSYIPTSGATSTRLQDIANNSGNSTLINSTEGVLYGEIASLSNETSSNYISLSDGTYDNRLSIFYTSGSNIIRAFLRVGGASQADMTFTVSDITEFHKVAFKYKENDFALWINGVEVATDTSGSTIPSGTLTKLSFSEINTTGGLFRGKSKALAVYKEALTDAQLQSLTTI